MHPPFILDLQGKRLWVHKLPDAITLLEMMDFKTQGVKGIIVALRNKEVRIYRGKSLVNMLQVDVRERCACLNEFVSL